jgi:hypothetical protein
LLGLKRMINGSTTSFYSYILKHASTLMNMLNRSLNQPSSSDKDITKFFFFFFFLFYFIFFFFILFFFFYFYFIFFFFL